MLTLSEIPTKQTFWTNGVENRGWAAVPAGSSVCSIDVDSLRLRNRTGPLFLLAHTICRQKPKSNLRQYVTRLSRRRLDRVSLTWAVAGTSSFPGQLLAKTQQLNLPPSPTRTTTPQPWRWTWHPKPASWLRTFQALTRAKVPSPPLAAQPGRGNPLAHTRKRARQRPSQHHPAPDL